MTDTTEGNAMPDNTITLNGVDYIPASEAGPKVESSKSIVILQRGWVFIGDLSKHGDEFTLSDGTSGLARIPN